MNWISERVQCFFSGHFYRIKLIFNPGGVESVLECIHCGKRLKRDDD